MKASPGAVAYVERLVAYYRDPNQEPHQDPPGPPSDEIALECGATLAQMMTIIVDYQRTGELHMDNPSVEAQLYVAEMIARHAPGR